MRRLIGGTAFLLLMLPCLTAAQRPGPVTPAAATPTLKGIYQTIADDVVLANGLRNSGSPDKIELLPAAAYLYAISREVDDRDPGRHLRVLGGARA